MEDYMWTDESMDMYAAQLSNIEQLVMRAAVVMGLDLDETLEFVYYYDNHADLDYAAAFFNSVTHPDGRVPLEG
jgi:hypothetical protein